MRPARRFRSLAVVLIMALIGACGTQPAPSVTEPATTPSSPPSPSASFADVPSATADASVLPAGSLVTTVSDRLRVRSEPRVSDDSVMYEPVLLLGTDLTVVAGPVMANDYVWYEVEVEPGMLQGGVTRGWVAMADHDGTPWIALAGAPIVGLEVVMSDVARASADPADARIAAAAVNAFAIDAYRQLLRDTELALATQNAVFSPTSIVLALGMTRAGARGDTAAEMDDVLHVEGWDELGPGLNALSQALASRSERWVDYDDAPREVALRIANTTFAQRGWTLEEDFLDAIAAAFGAGVNLVDYMADAEAARQTINAWVRRETADRIPELLEPPDVTSDTRLYLVNAIYMKAEWDEWFNEGATEPQTFTRLDGSRVEVPTMVAYRSALSPVAPFASGDGWKATELRYRTRTEEQGSPLAMTLIRPDDLSAFESTMTTKVLNEIVAALDGERDGWSDVDCPDGLDAGCYPYDLELYMPKFGIETRAPLGSLLQDLGMPTAFDPAAADLTGIHVPVDLADRPFIKNVIHQANIDVDEKGTEAAAATAVGVDTGGGPSALDQITFRLDRPFLFLLRDVETGAILFMGRVVDPSVGR
jgi:serpin B